MENVATAPRKKKSPPDAYFLASFQRVIFGARNFNLAIRQRFQPRKISARGSPPGKAHPAQMKIASRRSTT